MHDQPYSGEEHLFQPVQVRGHVLTNWTLGVIGSLVRYRQPGVGALLLDECKSIFSVWQPAALWTHDNTLNFKCSRADKTGILSPTAMFSNQNQNRSGL